MRGTKTFYLGIKFGTKDRLRLPGDSCFVFS